MATLRAMLTALSKRLATAGVDSPQLSAEMLLAHTMGMERDGLVRELIMAPDAAMPEDRKPLLESLAQRRENGEPAAYITGVKEFYGRDFSVTPATLIPRPDTETLVEAALDFAKGYMSPTGRPTFLDLGTGSGAIAVTVALESPSWHGLAIDISAEALHVAEQNARALGAANLDFLCCDFLDPNLPQGPFTMVLANPPYISEEEYQGLSPEVARFEPKGALVPNVGQANGLEYLFAILNVAGRLLLPGGLLLMEMGCTQGSPLTEQASSLPVWRDCRIIPDLAGLPRVFHALRA